MLRTLTALLALAALTASATAQTSALPAALLQAVNVTQAAKAPYLFDFDIVSSDQTWRARFNPNANPRLNLIEPALDSLERDERRAFERMAERMEGVPWCASAEMARVADVRLVREDETSATYAFQPTRESIRGEQARQYANRMRGEVTLTKINPDITHVRIYVPQAFSPMPLVNIERFNVSVTCTTAPNGRHYASETVSEVRGTAFGQALNERTVQRARNLSATHE